MNTISTIEKRKLTKTSFVVPFTQFDWGDYFTDTDYLDFEDHGIYWNLLRRYYTTGPFENDIKLLQRMTKCPKSKVDAMQTILEEFFFILDEDGCWHHKRCDEEIMRAKGNSEIQSKRARRGAAQKRRNANGQFVANNELPPTAGLSPAIKEEELITKDEEERIQEDKMNVLREKRRQIEINRELYKD